METTRRPHDLPPLLDAAREQELSLRIEAGLAARGALAGRLDAGDATLEELQLLARRGHEAWQEFWLANLRLVAQQAGLTARRSDVPADECFQEGCLALAQALARFDHRRGTRFSTYAYDWVRNAMVEVAARRGGSLEGPLWRARQARVLRRLHDELAADGSAVDAARLAQEVGRSQQWVQVMLRADAAPEPETALEHLACPRASAAFAAVESGEPEWLGQLNSLQARVLRLRFGLVDGQERSVAQCARLLGVSQSTLRRMERAALDQAREVLEQRATTAPMRRRTASGVPSPAAA